MGKYKKRKLKCVSCENIVEGNFIKTRKYCSRKCYNTKRPTAIKNPLISKSCETCSNVFETKEISKRFCSVKCQNKWQSRNKVNFICKTCGNHFGLSKSLAESRIYKIKFCSIKCRNFDEEWQKAPIIANIAQQNKKGPNRIEIAGSEILNNLKINFTEQVLMFDKFLVDVLLTDYKIIIQWDGDYWHGYKTHLKNGLPDNRQKKRMQLDISQDKYMNKAGYTILRFWEHDIKNNKNIIYEDIKRAIH